jgi:protein-L-isoaspartate O-methyltransferase
MNTELSVDSAAAKAATREQWNQMAKGWNDSSAQIRPWLHEATQAMLGMAGVNSGSHVLDVAAGAGDQTLDIAQRVGPEGYVLATDLSPDILQFAERQAAAAGHRNVETCASDGESLQVEAAQFDAVVCRLGLMLFRDPLQGPAGDDADSQAGRRRVHDGVLDAADQSLCHQADVDGAAPRRPTAA